MMVYEQFFKNKFEFGYNGIWHIKSVQRGTGVAVCVRMISGNAGETKNRGRQKKGRDYHLPASRGGGGSRDRR